MTRSTNVCLLAAASLAGVASALPTWWSSSSQEEAKVVKRDAIPSYAITYAPYSYLYSGENYWPSDVSVHLQHTTPEVNFAAVGPAATMQTLDSLASNVYLTSDDNVETNPAWLTSISNKPNASGYSPAPATIIVADKGAFVDVFYFYFYSNNFGLDILGEQFGNHVGDWEHSMIRFYNGVPKYIYLSEHSSGSAYNFTALATSGSRPVTYMATGSHANYATAGKQAYEGGFLEIFGLYDTTNKGVYWDVTQNYRGFFFDNSTQTFSEASGVDIGGQEQGAEGVSWLSWLGAWGDQQYPTSDSRQNCDFEAITNECHFVSGPTGPFAKNLGRTALCENESSCTIKTST